MSKLKSLIYLTVFWVLFSCPGTQTSIGNNKNILDIDNQVEVLYVIGGSNSTKQLLNDIWFSIDGVTWQEITEKKNERFSPRLAHQTVALNNTLYVVGGSYDSKRLKDVWSSKDGSTWKRLTETAGFAARYNHQVVSMGNALYLIAGDSGGGGTFFNDVWKSSDGSTWSEVTPNEANKKTEALNNGTLFSARNVHQVVVKDNAMYLIGGYNGTTRLKDVWKSSDGATWENLTKNKAAEFSTRSQHQAVVLKNEIYIIGGWNGAVLNDVWKSSDGKTWSEVTPKDADKKTEAVNNGTLFPARRKHTALVMNDKIYIIAGDSNSTKLNDVWVSEDGATWRKLTENAGFSARNVHAAAVAKRTIKQN